MRVWHFTSNKLRNGDPIPPAGPHVGLKAKFFHPKTLGVMHRGEVKKVHKDGTVTVQFVVTFKGKRVFRTTPEFI